MKIFYLIAFFIFAFILPRPAFAIPQIHDIIFIPSTDIWVGETLVLKVNCTDVKNITSVYAQIKGEDGFWIPDKNLTFQEGLYSALIESDYLLKPNNFDVNVFCMNNESQQTNKTANFTVSEFKTRITAIFPSKIYLSDIIEIDFSVEKNDEPISSGVSFNVTLNGEVQRPRVDPPYDPAKGFIIYLNSPNASGTYNLRITAFYGRINKTESTSFEVYDPIQFSIKSVDRSWVKPNDTINLQVEAFDRGNIIPLSSSNLVIKIGPAKASIIAIAPVSNYFNIAIVAPNLSPGSYSLTAFLTYGNYTYTSSKTIDYIVPISGKIVDVDGKGIAAQLRFLSNMVEKLRVYTDANGVYSSNLPPGTYDIEVTFPESKFYLKDVSITSFEDPIRYCYLTSTYVEGLNLAGGVYVYEVALSYYRASIEMKYDERDVWNENELKVYKCDDWNTGRKTCYGKWSKVDFSIDKIRNVIHVNTTRLSTYAIGTLKQLFVEYTINKEKFSLKDLVKVRGVVMDEERNPVSNATVRISIKNAGINLKTTSDNNGVFSLEFLSPEKEGNYSLAISAEKSPYLSFNSSKNIQVVKSREISIVFPDTVKVAQGENFTQDFTVVNTGQADLYNLNITLTGIVSWYYTLTPKIEKLNAGEEIKLSIYFSVPSNASLGTSSATLKVFNDEVSKEKIFGFTIVEKNQTVVTPTPITGLFGIVLPQITQDFTYILLFALVSFSLAFFLKKRKVRNVGREEIRNLLFDIKGYMKRKESEISTPMTSAPQTIPLISTETEKTSQKNSEVTELNKLEKDLSDKNSANN